MSLSQSHFNIIVLPSTFLQIPVPLNSAPGQILQVLDTECFALHEGQQFLTLYSVPGHGNFVSRYKQRAVETWEVKLMTYTLYIQYFRTEVGSGWSVCNYSEVSIRSMTAGLPGHRGF